MSVIMKKMIVLFTLLFAFFTAEVFGQNYSDAIRLQMPNKTTVEYKMFYRRDRVHRYNHQKLEKLPEATKKELSNFLKRWKVLGIADMENKKPLFIEDLKTQIKMRERGDGTTIFFPEDTKLALTEQGKHKLKIKMHEGKDKWFVFADVYFYFDSIKQLQELLTYDFDKILKEGDKALQVASADRKNRKTPLEAWLSVDTDKNVGLTYQKFKKSERHTDYITLDFSPNIENINGDWLSGCRVGLACVLNAKHRFGVSYEFMYNFTDTKTTNISHWLDAGYAINTEWDAIRWLGIDFGFMVKQHGDFFDNHKFRLGLPMGLGNRFVVTPEFYYKKFFKKSEKENKYFGVKLAFSL